MFDLGRHDPDGLGFALLATDPSTEDGMMALMPEGVGAYFARITTLAPLVRSNLAMAWNVLRKTHVNDRLSGCGRLLKDH